MQKGVLQDMNFEDLYLEKRDVSEHLPGSGICCLGELPQFLYGGESTNTLSGSVQCV